MEETTTLVGTLFVFVLYAVLIAFALVVNWKIFTKAGKPGWAAIVPVYNFVVITEITGRPTWWVALYVLVSITTVIIPFDLAKSFGKGSGFAVGMLLLPIVFYPILAFDKNITYQGPAVEAPSAT